METSSVLEEDESFFCSICQDIYKTPVKTMNCGHVFCKTCFLSAVQAQGLHCPYCRGPLTDRERLCPARARDVENLMRTASSKCVSCGKKMKVRQMRLHYRRCKLYKEEYSSLPVVPKCESHQAIVGNRIELSYNTAATSETLPSQPQLRNTFLCPYCQQTGFDQKELLEHCNMFHLFDWRDVVCPICACMPWGNTSQVSRNFIQHLNLRHKFDYAEFVDFHHSEDLHLQSALMESFLE